MRIIANKPVHQQLLNRDGKVTINGIVFRAGLDGKPTANVTDAQVNLFRHAEGFSLYHEDGTYSGPTGQTNKMQTHTVTASLSAAESEARAHEKILEMINSGNVPDHIMQALMSKAPIIGATSTPAPVTISTTQAGVTTGTSGAVTVTTGDDADENLLPPGGKKFLNRDDPAEAPVSSEAPADVQAKASDDQADQTDMSDPDSIAKLPRAELFGLARSFHVKVSANDKSLEIATKIADAFKETPEYKAAQAAAQQ